ncbi:MAG: hypothetical protein K9N06_05855 [Candidatus Cloacimonetes bacterium]|nr:hypothetical protein [Candidatus Cloacimonadota bacterium]
MKKVIFLSMLIAFSIMSATVYEVELTWDEFGAECNGILTGSVDNNQGFVQGMHPETTLNGALISKGEDGSSFSSKQRFIINTESGYFSFWVKDKFADDDLNPDFTSLAAAKPLVKIFQNGSLIDQIAVSEGTGLVCKVFNLDAENGEIDHELRYYPRSRMVIGSVIDCVIGTLIPNVSITLSGEFGELQNLTTDAEGFFMFPCEIGHYELSVSKKGYIGYTLPVVMGIDESPREYVIALSETIQNYRIVLTWGSRPRDLDAHLSGPNPDGGNFHIWYQDHYPMGGKDFLDRDDRSSYGPETITIYKPAKGVYQYSVFDYSHRSSKRAKDLQRSGARVDIYGENRLLKTFYVPEGRGNTWHVFRIDETNNIIPINTVTYCADDKNIHE